MLLHLRDAVSTAEGDAGDTVVATHARANLALTQKELCRLRPKEWLGDEVINMYLALLQVRWLRLLLEFSQTAAGRSHYCFKQRV